MLAGLPYVLWPVGSLFILASRKKDDPYLHYHAVQGGLFGGAALLLLLVGLIALAIIFRLLPGSSTWLPGMLGLAVMGTAGMGLLAVFFTAIFLGWRATEGEMIRLPFAGDFAENKMLDHTGMTRRAFIEMLEKSFIEPAADEPEPIPFPEVREGAAPATALSGRAAELLASQVDDTTPAAQKAAELLAHRQARQAAAEKAQAAQAAALAAQQKAAALAAQQAAALQAAQRPLAQPGGQRPGTVSSAAGSPAPRPAVSPRPAAQPPASAARPPEVKSYPLVGGTAAGQAAQPGTARPQSPPPNAARPPQPAAAARPPQPAANRPPQPTTGRPPQPSLAKEPSANPQVKEVDLIRHYQERRAAAPQKSEALRNWLSTVDEGNG